MGVGGRGKGWGGSGGKEKDPKGEELMKRTNGTLCIVRDSLFIQWTIYTRPDIANC